MKYVVYRTKSELYLNTSNGVTWVKEQSSATIYRTKSHVEREVKARKNLYDDVIFIELEEKKYSGLDLSDIKVTLCDEDIAENMESIKNYSTLLAKSVSEIEQLVVYYQEEQKNCDLETQDILHKIELNDINNIIDGWKYAKMLQEVRRRRRIAKDNLAFLSCLINNGVLKIAKGVGKYNSNQETRTYTPRVLTELFEEGE